MEYRISSRVARRKFFSVYSVPIYSRDSYRYLNKHTPICLKFGIPVRVVIMIRNFLRYAATTLYKKNSSLPVFFSFLINLSTYST